MKNFFIRSYHLILLGLAALLALGSATYLILQFLSFKDSFSHPSSAKASSSEIFSPSTNALATLSMVKGKVFWSNSPTGSSPFVSRPYLLKDGKLVDPMISSAPPLFPPVPNQWLMDHQLDYTDVNILERDPNNKGFTVLEEFLAGTDPNDLTKFPNLCAKLTYSDADIKKSTYLLEYLGDEENEGRSEYQLRPVLPIPNPAKGNKPDTSVRGVIKGETVPGVPFLKVIDYVDKKKTINDTEYDFGELILQNTLTGERHALTKKNVSRDYQKHPIQLVESVTFHYQLTGAPAEDVPVERGKEFTLGSLDKKHTETYKLVDFSNEGILLEKGGKTFTVKPSAPMTPPITGAPTATPTPDH
jgi:hypothetical protein